MFIACLQAGSGAVESQLPVDEGWDLAMKFRICCLIALIIVLLCGCSAQEQNPDYTESRLVPGTLFANQLTVEEGNYKRSNLAAKFSLVECESGYYFAVDTKLYYADKTDLNYWVPVCGDPECDHLIVGKCSALLGFGSLSVADDRIYRLVYVADYPHLYSMKDDLDGVMLCSFAPNGEDARLEHIWEDTLVSGGGMLSADLFPDGYVVSSVKLNPDGSSTATLYYKDSNLETALLEQTQNDMVPYLTRSASAQFFMFGDNAIATTMIDSQTIDRWLCWIHEGEMVVTDVSELPTRGAYLSANTLRCFTTNDGYYDVDLLTEQKTKLADAQLENSAARILQPNCIIESTLLYSGDRSIRSHVENHAMRFFDGVQWHDVALPKELQDLSDSVYLGIAGLTSDSVFFVARMKETGYSIYQMALDEKECKLVYCGFLNS